jgi:hypothetical protein
MPPNKQVYQISKQSKKNYKCLKNRIISIYNQLHPTITRLLPDYKYLRTDSGEFPIVCLHQQQSTGGAGDDKQIKLES